MFTHPLHKFLSCNFLLFSFKQFQTACLEGKFDKAREIHDRLAPLHEAMFVEASPGVELTVDLPSRTITAGEQRFSFQIDDYTANRLLQGLDDIGSTLHHADEIAAFEAKRPAFKPTTLPMRVAD